MRSRLLLAALLCFALGAEQVAAQATRGCAVTALQGQNARMELGGAWQQIQTGPLPASVNKVETGAATRLEVSCEDGFIVTVGPDSEADLGALVAPPVSASGLVIALLEGIIGIVTPERTEGPVEVRTPAVIAAVRSTAWLVEHDPEVGSAVFVREGRVTVSNREIAVVLREGEGITLTRDSTLRPPARWGQARIDQSTEALGLGWE